MQSANWYTSKWAIVCYHIMTWLVTLFLPHIMRPMLERPEAEILRGHIRTEWEKLRQPPPHSTDTVAVLNGMHPADSLAKGPRTFIRRGVDPGIFTRVALVLNLAWIGLFYLNAYRFIPGLVYRRKVAQYALIQLVILLIVFGAVAVFLRWKLDSPLFRFPMPLLFNIFPFLFVQAGSLAYRLIVDKIATERKMKEAENEGLKTELSFLRSQISPHFIFNVLNNLVALARKKSDLLEPSLIRLSGIMRYMLYESDETKVPLRKELEYLLHYIDLQQLRFGNDIRLDVSLQQPDDNYYIEPMLLIPFVENAFKHSTGTMDKPSIVISFSINRGLLKFDVQNTFRRGESLPPESSGIGLANVRRRLNLLYADRHSLMITEQNNTYLVSLQIQLV